MTNQFLSYLETRLSTSTLGHEEREEILNALNVADDIEIQYIAYYIGLNQQQIVREGKASQKEITAHIKMICEL